MTGSQKNYAEKGYTEAEVEILIELTKLRSSVDTVAKDYVKRSEFEPIQKLVYGVVGLILIAVMSGVVALVLQ